MLETSLNGNQNTLITHGRDRKSNHIEWIRYNVGQSIKLVGNTNNIVLSALGVALSQCGNNVVVTIK